MYMYMYMYIILSVSQLLHLLGILFLFALFVNLATRAQHSESNHIPPSVLPSFLDLVIWGHEHECHTEVEYEGNTHYSQDPTDQDLEEDQGFYVYQPGSSVATSLSEGEEAKKWVSEKNDSWQEVWPPGELCVCAVNAQKLYTIEMLF